MTCNMDQGTQPFAILLSSNTVSSVGTGHQKSILLALVRDSGKLNCCIRDSETGPSPFRPKVKVVSPQLKVAQFKVRMK